MKMKVDITKKSGSKENFFPSHTRKKDMKHGMLKKKKTVLNSVKEFLNSKQDTVVKELVNTMIDTPRGENNVYGGFNSKSGKKIAQKKSPSKQTTNNKGREDTTTSPKQSNTLVIPKKTVTPKTKNVLVLAQKKQKIESVTLSPKSTKVFNSSKVFALKEKKTKIKNTKRQNVSALLEKDENVLQNPKKTETINTLKISTVLKGINKKFKKQSKSNIKEEKADSNQLSNNVGKKKSMLRPIKEVDLVAKPSMSTKRQRASSQTDLNFENVQLKETKTSNIPIKLQSLKRKSNKALKNQEKRKMKKKEKRMRQKQEKRKKKSQGVEHVPKPSKNAKSSKYSLFPIKTEDDGILSLVNVQEMKPSKKGSLLKTKEERRKERMERFHSFKDYIQHVTKRTTRKLKKKKDVGRRLSELKVNVENDKETAIEKLAKPPKKKRINRRSQGSLKRLRKHKDKAHKQRSETKLLRRFDVTEK